MIAGNKAAFCKHTAPIERFEQKEFARARIKHQVQNQRQHKQRGKRTQKRITKGVEGDIRFTAEHTADRPATVIPEEIQDDLINAVEGCQNGPISMLHDFPGTVESSSNLAIVKSEPDGQIYIKILVRSSSESRKDALRSSLESVFALAGARVESGNPYGGWQPNIDSPILRTMESVYESLFGRKPDVTVMHAGLECGIIQGAYPDMDMISFGPDIKHPHSPDEAVGIASVEKSWRLLRATLEAIPEK